ncbi:uncharacterized protein LOC134532673 [Bacillus rossius redtenbacheri]|uniref:uncharacterized protein LOC134532673 n=1 Tax=Bacillus rossius redtenbacheri TaxID=93214 RepID=UPI002FDD7850
MEKLTFSNLLQLFEEKPPDRAVRRILSLGTLNLQKKDFVCLLSYLLEIIHPKGYEKLPNANISKSEERRFRGSICTLLSEISEMYPEAPPLPNVLPSHLIQPIGENITCLLWKLSMIALIAVLQKNHDIEVEKYPAGDHVPRTVCNYFKHLAVENEAAVDNCVQEKEALVKMFVDEKRDLRATIDGIKQETEVLRGILKDAVGSLDLDGTFKIQLADLNTQPEIAGIQASLDERFRVFEAVLNNLESCPGLAEDCRMLLEYHECQKVTPVYLCGDGLLQKFPHMNRFKNDEFSLKKILEHLSEKLEIFLKDMACFKTLYEEHEVEALSLLEVHAQEVAACRTQLEHVAEVYRDKYWAMMVPSLRWREEASVQEPYFELCKTVSELACLPTSNLKLSPRKKMEHVQTKFKKDWFGRPDVQCASPNYMYFFKSKDTTAGRSEDFKLPMSSRAGDLDERLPFSTIKKPQAQLSLRAHERVRHAIFSPDSPLRVESGNDSFPEVKMSKSLEKEVRKVLTPSDADCLDAYTTTPPHKYPDTSDASDGSIVHLSQISMPLLNLSGSSEDSDRLDF